MAVSNVENQIKDIQSQFQAKIQSCVASGKAEQIPLLVAEMTEKINSLVNQTKASLAVASETSVFSKQYTKLNLDDIAHPSDLSFFKNLSTQPAILEAVKEIEVAGHLSRGKRYFLANAMRLTENISKPFFQILEQTKARLGLSIPVEIFVVPDQAFNAGALPNIEGKFTIFLTSGLLEKFTDAEVAFVLGHELGHASFGHTRIPIDILVNKFGHIFSSREILELRSWGRSAEFSADRMGMICCQDFTAACQAFFKLSSGITSSNFQFSVLEYMNQYEDLAKYIKSSNSDQLDEFYSSHPLNPLRLRALELFVQAKPYLDTIETHSAPSALNRSEMEQKINDFTRLFEPTYLSEDSSIAAIVREFIFLAAYMVAQSDGNFDETEAKHLASILNSSDAHDRVAALRQLSPQNIIDQIKTHAKKITFEVSPVQRLNIVRDVFQITLADGILLDREIEEMAKVCGVLAIHPGFLEELQRNIQPPMPQKTAA